MTVAEQTAATMDWAEANERYLRSELERLRLLLKRRVLWLRTQWARDSLQSYQGLLISEAQADRLLAGDTREAERRFYLENVEAVAISRSLVRVEQILVEQAQALQAAGRPAPLDALVRLFALSAFERDLLLLCLAPELDPAIETLYAYVQDDATRKYPTAHLALLLFPGKPEEGLARRERLMADAPLRRFLLLTMEPGDQPATASISQPLKLSPRIADYLLGANRLDEQCAALLREVSSALLPPQLGALVDRLQEWLDAQKEPGLLTAINLIGPAGSGKRAVARALCDRLGLGIFALDAARLPAPGPERQKVVRLLEREAVLLQFALYLDVTDGNRPSGNDSRAALNDLVNSLSAFVLVGSTERLQGERALLGVAVPKPTVEAQREVWRLALAGMRHPVNGQVDALVQQFDFGPTAISEALSIAGTQAGLRAPGPEAEITMDDLWQACREQACWRLDDLAQRIVPCHTWEDIVLPDNVEAQLKEIAAQVAHRAKVYESWGFGAKLNRGRGISALFSGPSGTGKTLAAEILAHHLDLHLYRIDLSGVVSKYIGETEKNLRKVFDTAEQSGAILFFDEADALFGKRSEVKDSHDRYANIEVNYLLQRMEEYRGLAILATNMKSHLDQAFLRRLRFHVEFPFPDAAHRSRIWRQILPGKAPLEGLDFNALSRFEIAGGSIKNIALNAAFLAAENEEPIRMEHLFQAARREYSKIEKLMQEPELRSSGARVNP